MPDHIEILQDSLVKGKVPKEIVEVVKDLKDLAAFNQGVSCHGYLFLPWVHLAGSLFVQLENFVLRRDSYLDHVKCGLKVDTWNQLCNAPLFHGGSVPRCSVSHSRAGYCQVWFYLSCSGARSGCTLVYCKERQL